MIGSYAGLGGQRRRGRRRGSWTAFRFLLGMAGVAAVGGYGYQVGVAANQAWTDRLEADLQHVRQDNLNLRDELAQTALGASSAQTELEALRRRYAAEVPDGELADLFAQIEEQLRAGVDSGRLAFLIDAAGQEVTCAEAPVTKRFRPHTPITPGPVSAVRFGDRITVTATAESALDADGQPEAWYDPARPVQLVFRTLDGRELQVDGALPLAHRMLVDGMEYRFSAIAGPTSFVEITGQACPFP
ncbi:MAG TPA: hypothetical protein VFV80_09690 [Geminicoccaceae bacterium]|nr:hypothetical protein [Geminicoccaceae bacterium]